MRRNPFKISQDYTPIYPESPSRWKGIVIHYSALGWGTEKDIDRWHKNRGWNGTGYHFIITNENYNNDTNFYFLDGQISAGRNIHKTGAHVRGHNKNNLGICLTSNGLTSIKQLESLFILVKELCFKYNIPYERVVGHRELADTLCPGFDVDKLREALIYDSVEYFIQEMGM